MILRFQGLAASKSRCGNSYGRRVTERGKQGGEGGRESKRDTERKAEREREREREREGTTAKGVRQTESVNA